MATEQQLMHQQRCFGCNMDAFVASVENSITFQAAGPSMVIMSLLSDAQHEVEYGMKEEARMTINRAKFLIDRYMNGSHIRV